MAREQKVILRVQSSDGTKRLEVADNISVDRLIQLVGETHGLPTGSTTWRVFRDRQKTSQLFAGPQTLKGIGFRYAGARMDVDVGASPLEMARRRTNSSFNSGGNLFGLDKEPYSNSGTPETSRASESNAGAGASEVLENEVDQLLWQQDGSIQRPKDERLCKHGSSGKCIYCIPIEPFDEEYLQSRVPPIKHMSFHAYLRKLTSGVNKGKFAVLNELSCRIKPGCTSHLPWPEGICTKCQPGAVTLNRQRYRHVDNILFENAEMVDRFLDYYRKTGCQRIGFLYGRYELHKDVPLGIRATVAAIYEPPQNCTENSIELREDPNSEVVDCVATKMGLRRVGWIFTDLVAEDLRSGTVKYLRHKDTYFLTAEECITAAMFQSQNPNPCKLSPTGQFGSKFVTVIVTGDSSSQIHFEGYQVSNQCMSLVRDNCLVPTYDVPELAYVKESSSQQYVPDVFYKEKDGYGNEVTRLSRPLPVEYLIVDVPAAMPKEPQFTFKQPQGKPLFPVENRMESPQDINALLTYTSHFSKSRFVDAISDFHVLIYMATTENITLQDEDLDVLVAAIMSRDADIAETWSTSSEYWKAVQRSHNGRDGGNGPSSMSNGSAEVALGEWVCKHCTYVNNTESSGGSCEMCALPR